MSESTRKEKLVAMLADDPEDLLLVQPSKEATLTKWLEFGSGQN